VDICLERGADLHIAQLMPLSLASVKSRLVLPFWYRLTWVVPEKGLLNGCARVCLWSDEKADWSIWGQGFNHVLLVVVFVFMLFGRQKLPGTVLLGI